VQIADVSTGKWVSQIPAAGEAHAVGLSEDGRRLAVAERNRFAVWNLTDAGSPPKSYRISGGALEPHMTLGFLGERLLTVPTSRMGGRLGIFSVKHELHLWSYDIGQGGGGVQALVGDHLLWCARHLTVTGAGSSPQVAVGAFKLPGVNLEPGEKSLTTAAKTLVSRGQEVQLNVEAGQFNNEVRAALEKHIAENGWKLVPAASTVITATMTRGEKKRVTYMVFGGGQNIQSALIEPYLSDLKIEVGGKYAFGRHSHRGDLPDRLELKRGETIQALVAERQKPDVEFFATTDIPEKITDPFHQTGGTSTIGPQQIRVQPLR
jgi:hypothetical protein